MPQTGIRIDGKPIRSANRYWIPLFFDACVHDGSANVDRNTDESCGMSEHLGRETMNSGSFRDRKPHWVSKKKK
ncbi:MAG: hypothetical protein KGQ60_18850 [Planctomycetes bacterium]|nr:hypothetical protein [Planctomycetota bacterium]